MIVYEKDREYNKNLVGGKGYGLFRLARYGFRVPDFFVIEAGTDINDPLFLRELNAYAEKLGGDLFSVRSSGVSEDGENASFAGQYHTELNVHRNGLISAVRKVCSSIEGKSAKVYSKRMGDFSDGIAVIVQKQIASKESGVLFSTAPQAPQNVLIECVKGSGENLVSGMVTPHTFYFQKGELPDGYMQELVEAAKYLEEQEKCPVDVEWAYDGQLWFLQLRRQTVLFDTIPQIPKRNWNLYVFRDFTVFNHSVQALASQKDIQQQLFGFFVPITEGLLVCGREFYSEENDAAANAIWGRVDQGDFFEGFLNRIEKIVQDAKRRTSSVKIRDYTKLSNKQLLIAYKREIAAYLTSYVPMMMRPDEYLRDRLVCLAGAAQADVLINAVAALLPPTYYSGERDCFLRAVACGNGSYYLKKYEWKNNPLGKKLMPVTEQEFLARAAGITPEQASERLEAIQARRRTAAAHARKTVSGLNGDCARLVNLILRFTYYRTRTAEISDRYFYYLRKNLLSEIGRRFGFSDETLLLYRTDEIEALFEGVRLSEAELIKRRNGEAIIFQNGEHRVYFGASAYSLLRELLPAPDQSKSICGTVACAGEVSGIVKIVTCFEDAENMQAGSILVASMTTPDISIALEKAIGIITDEGGITCHASIIAREYAIPCLVGTKVATQVLRDGMEIKLDCIKGCFYIDEET